MIPLSQNLLSVTGFQTLETESHHICLFNPHFCKNSETFPQPLFRSLERTHSASVAEIFRKIKVKKLSGLGR